MEPDARGCSEMLGDARRCSGMFGDAREFLIRAWMTANWKTAPRRVPAATEVRRGAGRLFLPAALPAPPPPMIPISNLRSISMATHPHIIVAPHPQQLQLSRQ